MKPIQMSCAVFLFVFSMIISVCVNARDTYYVGDADVIDGDFHVPAGETVKRTVLVTKGTALIDGTLIGDCIADGADIVVNGKVDGSVASFGKDRQITITGHVQRGVISYKGRLNISGKAGYLHLFDVTADIAPSASAHSITEFDSKLATAPGAKIALPVRSLTTHQFISDFVPAYKIWHPTPIVTRLAESAALFSGAGLTMLLPFLLFLRRTESAVLSLENQFWKSLVLGLMAVCPVSGLAFLIVKTGLIWLLLPLVGLSVPCLIIGAAAFFRMTGNKLATLAGAGRPGPMTAAVTGYILPALLALNISMFPQDPGQLRTAACFAGVLAILVGAAAGIGAILVLSPNPFGKNS